MSGSQHDDDDDVPTALPLWKQKHARIIAGVFVALLLILFFKGSPKPRAQQEKVSQQSIGAVIPYQSEQPESGPPPPPLPKPPPPAPAPQPQPPALPTSPPQPPPMPHLPTPLAPPHADAPPPERPVMLSFAVPHTDGPASSKEPLKPAETGISFKASSITGVKASPAVDETYMLMPGLLPCVLDTAIASDVPSGPLLCHTVGPVYSPKGTLLMEADTRIVGQYEGSKGGDGTSGNRLQAVSAVAYTPNGVIVPLVGPMADDLGRTGLPGTVDRRYFERFGAAVLLDISQGAMGILQAEVSKGGDTYLNVSGSTGTSGLASQILQAQINLPPIFTKNQGTMIAIWITQPVSFADSYRIKEGNQ